LVEKGKLSLLKTGSLITLLLVSSLTAFAEASASKFYVSNLWSIENYKAELGTTIQDSNTNKIQEAALTVLYLPPVNIISYLYFRTLGRDSDNIAEAVVRTCTAAPLALEELLTCLSQKISRYVNSLPSTLHGVTYDARTFCAVAAHLFEKSFNLLRIPRSAVGYMDATTNFPSLHVINSFTLTDNEGRTYGYAIDVGVKPLTIFPTSISSQRYHDPMGTGKTSIKNFPNFDFYHPGMLNFQAQ